MLHVPTISKCLISFGKLAEQSFKIALESKKDVIPKIDAYHQNVKNGLALVVQDNINDISSIGSNQGLQLIIYINSGSDVYVSVLDELDIEINKISV